MYVVLTVSFSNANRQYTRKSKLRQSRCDCFVTVNVNQYKLKHISPPKPQKIELHELQQM